MLSVEIFKQLLRETGEEILWRPEKVAGLLSALFPYQPMDVAETLTLLRAGWVEKLRGESSIDFNVLQRYEAELQATAAPPRDAIPILNGWVNALEGLNAPQISETNAVITPLAEQIAAAEWTKIEPFLTPKVAALEVENPVLSALLEGYVGFTRVKVGDFAGALKALDSALMYDSQNPNWLALKGEALAALGRTAEANEVFDALLCFAADAAPLVAATRAAATADQMSALTDKSTEANLTAWRDAVSRAYYNGDYAGTLVHSNKFISLFGDKIEQKLLKPILAEIYYFRGLARQKNAPVYESVIQDFSQAIALNADNNTYYTARGVAYFDAGDETNAKKDFTKALELNENDDQALQYLELLHGKATQTK